MDDWLSGHVEMQSPDAYIGKSKDIQRRLSNYNMILPRQNK
jgi:hypothetical protein